MQVHKIQSETNFKAKPKYITPALRQGMVNLKTKMESETVIIKGRLADQTISVRGVEIQDNAVFKNGKFLAKKDKKNKKLVPYGSDTSMVEFGKVRIIARDGGEFIEGKKPFYKSWSKVFEQANEYIQFAIDNYNDRYAVKKVTQKKENLTSLGKQQMIFEYNKIMALFNKINPWSK